MRARRARWRLPALAWLTGSALAIASCGTSIPPGAQQVHLTGTATEVRLEPATVHAGDVYFVVDGSATLVWHASGDLVDGQLLNIQGLSDDELDRLARTGDLSQTGISEMGAGYAGNVLKWTLPAGKYAFVPVRSGAHPDGLLTERAALCSTDPDACSRLPLLPLTVLEVLP